jgi:hypothetical protein
VCLIIFTCPSFRPALSLSLDKVLIKFYFGYLLISANKIQVCLEWDNFAKILREHLRKFVQYRAEFLLLLRETFDVNLK